MRVGPTVALVAAILVLGPGTALGAEGAPPNPDTPAVVAPSAATPSPAPALPEARLGFDDLETGPSSAAEGVAGAWAVMIKGTVALCAVLIVIYLVLGKGLAKLNQKTSAQRRIHVLDRVGLDHKRTLFLVEVDGVRTLVGASDHGMSIAIIPNEQKPFKDHLKDAAAVATHDPPARDDAALALSTPRKSPGEA